MVYFLVNNNSHIVDFTNLYPDIKDMKLSLIQVPHTLNIIISNHCFEYIYLYQKLKISFIQLFLSYKMNKRELNKIDTELYIQKDDTLFVYTEFELVNQYIIEKFNKIGARVYLLENGAATSYLFMSAKYKKSIKNDIRLLFLKLLYGFNNTRLLYDGRSTFPILKDNCIDAVFFYLKPKRIIRNIKAYSIKQNIKQIDSLNSQTIIFLNQGIYSLFDNFDCYLNTLNNAINHLSYNFNKIYFKFHPREPVEIINKVRMVIEKNNGIIIDSKMAIEEIIENYKPKYAISFYSFALINLAFMGIEPIFIYSFIPNYKKIQVLNHFDIYLKSLNYNFVTSFGLITSKYESGLLRLLREQVDSVSIIDLITHNSDNENKNNGL